MARKPPAKNAPSPNEDLSIEQALARAYAHWNAGQADQAELFCQRVLAAWPGQADATHLMGVMAHAYGNLDLALQHVRQACMAPRAPAVYFSNLAEMCRQKGLLEEGEQAGRRAVTLSPDLVAGWNNLGIILQESGKLDESANCLERVVSLQPNNPEANNNLANTYKRLGRLDKAEQFYGKALSLNPNYAEAHSNLANLLNDLGILDKAAAEARLAIDINPRLADAYVNLAAIETSRSNHAEALRWLDGLLSFAPGNATALSAKAMTLKHFDRLDEALDVARRAVASAPNSADSHNALGQIQQAMNMMDLALQSYQKASTLPGTAVESAMVNSAVLMMEAGRKDEALAEFDRVTQVFPRSASAWFNSADLKKFKADDPAIARMEALLRPDGVQSMSDRMSMHFALGKAYLDAGNDEKAFIHLNEGNRMKRASFAFDVNETAKWMAGFAKVFTPALFKKLKGVGDQTAQPIFIVGIPRSGTTLIEQILASHPKIHGAGELRILQNLVDGIGDYPAVVKTMAGEDFKRLGQAYAARVQPLAQGLPFVVDKMPANFLHLGLLHLALPNARIIHCRRDPVDTCLSCYTKMFSAEQLFAYDLSELGHFHVAYQKMMAHWHKVLPADRLIDVEYEAVVDDVDGQARRLIEFLGLPWDDACTRFYENTRSVRTASVNQVRQPIYKTSSGRWKQYASHLQPLLKALGIKAA